MKKSYVSILLSLLLSAVPNISAQVFISEVFYDSPLNEEMQPHIGVDTTGVHHNGEFVELYNNSTEPIDLSGYSVGVAKYHYNYFVFPEGSVCPGKQCVIVAFRHPNSPDFKLEDLISSVKGQQIYYHSAFVLGNEGNTVILEDRHQIISDLKYNKIKAVSRKGKWQSVHYKNIFSKGSPVLYAAAPDPGVYNPDLPYEISLCEMLPESKKVGSTAATVGEIGLSASVTPTGAAATEVPLVFPAGINGIEPKLSVVYNSQGGIGTLGMGMDLSGLSVISRTGKNQFMDGKNEVTRFQTDGALAMDGQRLIRIENGKYRTYQYSLNEIDAAGTAGNGPAYFKVTSPQGIVAEYGTTEDSRVYTEDGRDILSWRVCKVTDLNGNSIRYTYTTDRTKGSYIREIIYGEDAGVHITFDYTEADTPRSSFVDGSFFHAGLLLSGINIACPGQTAFRKYSFGYSGDHLTKLTEHGTNGEELNLDYTWGAYSEDATWKTILDIENKDNSRFFTGDLDGDGSTDLIRAYLYKGKKYIEVFAQKNGKYTKTCTQQLPDDEKSSKTYRFYQVYDVLDINNDGKSEILVMGETGVDKYCHQDIYSYSYAETGFLSSTGIALWSFGLDRDTHIGMFAINKNNDNIPDWLCVDQKGYCLINYNFEATIDIDLKTVFSENPDIKKALPIDYDGDGISELLIRNNDKWYLTPLRQYTQSILLLDDSGKTSAVKYENAYITDVNKDGLNDIVFIANNLGLMIYFNKGNGTFDRMSCYAIYKNLIDNEKWANFAIVNKLKLSKLDIHMSNYNNDSQTECGIYAQFDSDGKKMSAFAQLKAIGTFGFGLTYFIINPEGYDALLSSDINNDGKEELIKIDNDKNIQALSPNTSLRNLLVKVTCNSITRAGFDYGFASNASLHKCPSNQTTSDTKYLNFPYPLVKTFTEPDGHGKPVHTSYEYHNGRYHTYLGILGFDKIEQSKTVEGNVLRTKTEKELDRSLFVPASQTVTSSVNGNKTDTQQTFYTNSKYNGRIKSLVNQEIYTNELDGLSTTKTYTYDETGRLITEKEVTDDDLLQEICYEGYTKYNLPTAVTKRKKHADDGNYFILRTEKTYDDKANILSVTEAANTDNPVTTSYTYYDNGKVHTETTSGRNVEETRKTYEYELADGRKKITRRDALSVTETCYNRFSGNPEKETIQLTNGPEAQTTYYGYDGLGRKNHVKYPTGKEWSRTLSWDTKGKGYYAVTEKATGEASVTKYFDVQGREIYQVSRQGDVQVKSATLYDACGRKTSEITMHPRKAGWTDYSYAKDGRLESTLTHTGQAARYAYNHRTVTIVRDGKTYSKTSDSWGNILEQTDPSGITIRHTYNSNGQPVRTQAGSHTITMTYDGNGNKLSMNDPDMGETAYQYDGYGRLTRYKDPKGEYALTYDEYGRTLQKKYTGGREINYAYVSSGNGVGLVRSIDVKDCSTEVFEYDQYGQVTTKTATIDKQKFVYTNVYDSWGRLVRHVAPNGYMLQYAYDDTDSHLTKVTDGGNKTLWTYLKDIPGREQSCLLGNGLKSTALSSESEEESTLKWTTPGGNVLLNLQYRLDPILGNVTSREESYAGRTFAEAFEYDEMDRLTRISGGSSLTMAYEPNGNIAFKEDMGYYRYNDGSRTHALTDIEEPAEELKGMSTQNVKYTEFNKVESVHEGAYKMVFWYGADEQRVKSELYRNALRIRTIYYGDGFERHIDTNGNVKEYTYLDSDGGCFGMVITENETSAAYYFHTDMLGSLIAISDARGAIVERRSYDAWGRRRNPNDWTDYRHNNTLGLTLIGYTFQEEMPEFNLINLNGRLYDPMLGRMLSPDPFIQDAENSQNYNRYSYCWNNPMKYNDPTGNFIFGAVFGPLGSILDGMMCSAWLYTGQAGLHWKAKDFFKSILIGGASGAVGGFAGGILKTTGFISGAINGAIGGFAAGTVSGSLSAWTSGASFMQGLKVGLKSGGLGAASSALLGGIVGGDQAISYNGNFWTGKGATTINEMVTKDIQNDLGGEYFKTDAELDEYLKKQNGWQDGKYGIDDISVEKEPGRYGKWDYYRHNGILNRMPLDGGYTIEVNGVCIRSQKTFWTLKNSIFLSPHKTLPAFTKTLNHELIHAYHNSLGLASLLGKDFHNATEHSAYIYTLLHSPTTLSYNNALLQLKMHPSIYNLGWPCYLIPLN